MASFIASHCSYHQFFFMFLGKCYNVPEDFLPQKARKPKVDQFHSEILKNIEVKQDQKEDKILSPESLQNIPAFLPYEAKQALLRELSRSDRKLPVHSGAFSHNFVWTSMI